MSKCETCGKQKYVYLCDGCIHDPSAVDKYEPMTNAGCEFCNDTLKRFPYILATSDTGDCGTVFEPVVCPKCGRWLQQPAEDK